MAWRRQGDKPLSEPIEVKLQINICVTRPQWVDMDLYYRVTHSNNWHEKRVEENTSLHWRHNDHDGVSNHQPHGCLFNHLFRRTSKKTSKLRVAGLSVGNSPGPVNSPHKGPVTRKMFPLDDVIMWRERDAWSYLLTAPDEHVAFYKHNATHSRISLLSY